MPLSVVILGAGAWGSTLATLAIANQHRVRLWSRQGSDSLETLLMDVDVLISAISVKGVADIAHQVQTLGLPAHTVVVTATKGLDPTTGITPSQLWQAALPQHSIVVLSGPNLSKEIEQGLPAATVVASINTQAATCIQHLLATENFRVYTNTDPLGTELGGTLKNVMAIATGVCDGLQLGTNAKAALITRALPEIIRVGTHLGAQATTFYGLSGLGDLLATCTSPLSRNYQVGYRLAQGECLATILATLVGTAEGVNTAQVLVQIAEREGISVPIAQQVYRLLSGQITPQAAVGALMERELKPEMGGSFADRQPNSRGTHP